MTKRLILANSGLDLPMNIAFPRGGLTLRRKKAMRKGLLIILCLLATCCATPPPQAALPVTEAGKKMVESCNYLGNVTGSIKVGYGFMSEREKIDNCKRSAKEQAFQLGATHIWFRVYGEDSSGAPFLTAQAFRCRKN
ncbi:MAG: hypothetical protein PVH99_16760 [Desulfobacteraceae bacterium]